MKSKSDTINLSSPFRADVAAWFVFKEVDIFFTRLHLKEI